MATISEAPTFPAPVPGFCGPSSILLDVAQGLVDGATGQRYVVSTQPIAAGSTIAVFGGTPIRRTMLEAQLAECRLGQRMFARIAIQVDEDIYLVSTADGPADWINHSCEPNAGLQGQVVLVALRDIAAGEEICFDYATSDGSRYDEFICRCGAPSCRGRVTGEDWRRQELWTRYGDHFSPYLKRRIAEAAKLSAGQGTTIFSNPSARKSAL